MAFSASALLIFKRMYLKKVWQVTGNLATYCATITFEGA